MGEHINSYITLVTTSAVLNVFLCLYTYFRRSEIPSSKIFILYTAALSVYTFGYAIELASNTLEQMKFWTVVEYIGMPFSAPLGLMLMMQYTGKRLSKKTSAALFVIPSITLFMVATNDFHHLFYKKVWLRENSLFPNGYCHRAMVRRSWRIRLCLSIMRLSYSHRTMATYQKDVSSAAAHTNHFTDYSDGGSFCVFAWLDPRWSGPCSGSYVRYIRNVYMGDSIFPFAYHRANCQGQYL